MLYKKDVWNKAMDPMKKNHPGAVTAVSVSPADPSKVLIGFASGLVTLWDLPSKKGEQRYFTVPGYFTVPERKVQSKCHSNNCSMMALMLPVL